MAPRAPQRLVFASPTYGPIDPVVARSQRAAIMHAAGSGAVTWVGDVSPNRMGWEASRNTIVQETVNARDPIDAIFWADSDVWLPTDAITRLVLANRPFITGLLPQRSAPYWPLVAQYDDAKRCFHFLTQWPDDVIGPVDGCGFGCVLTATAMLKVMQTPWFSFQKFSEDFEFCLNAKRAGFQLWMDTGLYCEHLGDAVRARIADFTTLRDSGQLDAYIRISAAA